MKISTIIISFLIFIPALALAQGGGGGPGPGTGGGGNPPVDVNIKFENPFKKGVGDNLYTLAQAIVNNIILPIGGVLCVLAFIYAGFLYVTAQGKPDKIKKASFALLYAAIGTAVLLGSWLIANVIENTVKSLM